MALAWETFVFPFLSTLRENLQVKRTPVMLLLIQIQKTARFLSCGNYRVDYLKAAQQFVRALPAVRCKHPQKFEKANRLEDRLEGRVHVVAHTGVVDELDAEQVPKREGAGYHTAVRRAVEAFHFVAVARVVCDGGGGESAVGGVKLVFVDGGRGR